MVSRALAEGRPFYFSRVSCLTFLFWTKSLRYRSVQHVLDILSKDAYMTQLCFRPCTLRMTGKHFFALILLRYLDKMRHRAKIRTNTIIQQAAYIFAILYVGLKGPEITRTVLFMKVLIMMNSPV